MPTKPLTHKPLKHDVKRHMVVSENDSKTRKDFTNASGYGYKWRKESKAYLKANPLCADCEARGVIKLSQEVHHIQAHRGNMDLFWSRSNWSAVCSSCHSSRTAKGE